MTTITTNPDTATFVRDLLPTLLRNRMSPAVSGVCALPCPKERLRAAYLEWRAAEKEAESREQEANLAIAALPEERIELTLPGPDVIREGKNGGFWRLTRQNLDNYKLFLGGRRIEAAEAEIQRCEARLADREASIREIRKRYGVSPSDGRVGKAKTALIELLAEVFGITEDDAFEMAYGITN